MGRERSLLHLSVAHHVTNRVWKSPPPPLIIPVPTVATAARGQETALNETPGGASHAPITLYTTLVCPYCVAAKNFFKSKGLSWTEIRIDTDPAERERMIARANRTSVPQIFVGDVHVGGFDDMMALHRAGKFEPLLSGEGA
jgi:glutaredoxin 3